MNMYIRFVAIQLLIRKEKQADYKTNVGRPEARGNFDFGTKRIYIIMPCKSISQDEWNGANFSFVAPCNFE